MDATTLFYVGLILGLITGALGTLVFVKVKSLFVSNEVRKLRQEKKGMLRNSLRISASREGWGEITDGLVPGAYHKWFLHGRSGQPLWS